MQALPERQHLTHAAAGGRAQGAVDSEGQPIDAAFYRTFWGLQGAFQAPYAAMEPSKWAAAVGDIKRVLAEFAKQARWPLTAEALCGWQPCL
jgi:hypothetical protein